jgi:hypothetical protein
VAGLLFYQIPAIMPALAKQRLPVILQRKSSASPLRSGPPLQ